MDLFRSTCRDLGVSTEGMYERNLFPDGKEYWVLKKWRVISIYEGRKTVGMWYKVHGNRKKSIGALKLILESPPKIDDPL